MASIILPGRWRRQPDGPVEVDWRNPLTNGLVGLITWTNGAWREIARGYPVSARNTVTRTRSIGYSTSGSEPQTSSPQSPTGVIVTGTGSQFDQSRPEITLLAHGFVLNSAATPGGTVSADHVSVAQCRIVRVEFENPLYVRFSFFTTDFLGGDINSPGLLTYNSPYVLSMSRRPGVDGFAAYHNGRVVSRANGQTGNIRGDAGVSGWNFQINTREDGGSGLSIPIGAHWIRALSDGEHQALAENPWQLLRPVRPRSFQASGIPPTPPNAPTIGTTTNIGITIATANWTDNSSDENSFEVQRENPSGAGNWTAAGTAAANATSLNLTGLTASTQYRLRVRATNGNGSSAWSTGGTFTTNAPASAPTVLVTDPVSVLVDTVTVSGTISSTETPSCTVSLAPQPSGTTIGPFSATISGSAPNFTFSRTFTAVPNNNYIATAVATNSGGSNSDPSLQFTVDSISGPGGGEVPVSSNDITASAQISLTGAANLNVSFTNLTANGVVALTASAFLQVPVLLGATGTLRLTGTANLPAVVQMVANATIRLTGVANLNAGGAGNLIGIGGGSIASILEYNNIIGGFKIGEGTIVVILSKNGGIVKE
ncbi:fibronectin type III domain-containing protein [Microcystis sp. M42BS1]|uniref:fibronectin type III domain-containing protein n=1 Tax=Microcystis sp. M42BS1 TaxID=2771192 RepID=UPI00258C95F1|nr:fibronectin type III domain-containing protein [Microcystis sp. M42BS1]MCA2570704.1 fibronectin type III domain-containing protein [Microcystis sp. M42BS1]